MPHTFTAFAITAVTRFREMDDRSPKTPMVIDRRYRFFGVAALSVLGSALTRQSAFISASFRDHIKFGNGRPIAVLDLL